MTKSGEDILKESIGKVVMWVGEDPSDDDDLIVLFDDFSGFIIGSAEIAAVEKPTELVKHVLKEKIQSAEGIIKLKELLKTHEEKINGAANNQVPPAPAAGA